MASSSETQRWPAFVFGALLLTVWAASVSAEAGSSNSFAAKCSEIDKCIKAVSEITGDKYMMDADVKGKVDATENLELTPANANLLLTKALHLNGFARVPLSIPGTYQVVRSRDARDTLLPRIVASADTPPELPDTWDLVLLVFKLKHPEVAEAMARNARSFMPANARIIPNELSGQMLITAAVPEVKNVYQIIKDMDVKPSPEMLKEWKEAKNWRDHADKKMMHEEKIIIHKGDDKDADSGEHGAKKSK